MPKALCSGRAISLIVVITTVLSGCGGDDDEYRPARCSDFAGTTQLPDVPLAYATEHLDIHVDEDRMFCAGSALAYERFYQYVGDELELELPARVPVFLSDAVGDYCPAQAPGCRTQDGVVFIHLGAVFHELVHAATCEWRSSSSKYLTEGLAVSFEPTPLTFKSDPRDFVTIGGRREFYPHYLVAGHFTRWLLEEVGLDAFRGLYELSPRAGGEGVLDALESAYGREAESIFADFEASAPYMWVPHHQCDDLDVLEPADGAWQFNSVFDCDDVSTLGPWEREGRYTHFDVTAGTTMYQSFLLEIESPATYRFEREFDTGVWVQRCLNQIALSEEQADQLWLQTVLFPDSQGATEIELTAGTYRVDVLRAYAEPHPVWLSIEPSGG